MENTPEIRKIEIEADTIKDLNTTRKWSMFIAILGFIALGIMVIAGVIAVLFLSVFNTGTSRLGISESLLLLGFLVFAAIYFFPVLYLYRFSKHTSNAVRTFDNSEMHKAFKNLKRYYVYSGILVILVLVIYFIVIIAAGASVAFLKDLGTGM